MALPDDIVPVGQNQSNDIPDDAVKLPKSNASTLPDDVVPISQPAASPQQPSAPSPEYLKQLENTGQSDYANKLRDGNGIPRADEISQSPATSVWDKVKDWFSGNNPDQEQAKAQNIMAIAKANNLDPLFVEKNYDALSKNSKMTGLTPDIGATKGIGDSLSDYAKLMTTASAPLGLEAAVTAPAGVAAALMAPQAVKAVQNAGQSAADLVTGTKPGTVNLDQNDSETIKQLKKVGDVALDTAISMGAYGIAQKGVAALTGSISDNLVDNIAKTIFDNSKPNMDAIKQAYSQAYPNSEPTDENIQADIKARVNAAGASTKSIPELLGALMKQKMAANVPEAPTALEPPETPISPVAAPKSPLPAKGPLDAEIINPTPTVPQAPAITDDTAPVIDPLLKGLPYDVLEKAHNKETASILDNKNLTEPEVNAVVQYWKTLSPQQAPEPADTTRIPNAPGNSAGPTDAQPITGASGATAPGINLGSERGSASLPIDAIAKPVSDGADYIKRSMEMNPVANDLNYNLNTLKSQNEADQQRAKQLLSSVNISPADAEAIYHHVENSAEPLTPGQQEAYEKHIKPVLDARRALFVKIRNEGIPIDSEGHTTRYVSGKGNILDRLKEGAENISQGSLLNKSSGQFKRRTMKALVSENGKRMVASIKNGEVVGFNKEVATPLGNIKMKRNKELMNAQIKPIQSRVDRLKREMDILQSIKTRSPISEARLSNLKQRTSELKEFIKDFDRQDKQGFTPEQQKQFDFIKNIHDEFNKTLKSLDDEIDSLENKKTVLKPYGRTSEKIKQDLSNIEQKIDDAHGKFARLIENDVYDRSTSFIDSFKKELDDIENLDTESHANAAAELQRAMQEIRILSKVRGAEDVVLRKQRIDTLQNKIGKAAGELFNISNDYDPSDLGQRFFIDKNGKKWSIQEATTKEIEANTNTQYHKNILLNELLSYNKLRSIDRAMQFMDAIKKRSNFNDIAAKTTGEVPKDWRPVNMPQFRGYAFEPRVADTLDKFYSQLRSTDNAEGVLAKINDFMTTSIFFNPLIHIPNIANHWAVNRGAGKWFVPKDYVILAKTGARAIDAVIHQNDDYIKFMENGGNPLYHKVAGPGWKNFAVGGPKSLADLMLEKMGEELKDNELLATDVAKALGYVNPLNLIKALYEFSGKATWLTNDVATLQAVFEEMAHGASMSDAIKNVAKHIPDYRMPARVLDSKALADIMGNRKLTMFSRYHYGALRSYGEMIKSLVGPNNKERVKSLDHLLMLGLITLVLYPQLDKLAKMITGDKNAKVRRAGASTVPYNTMRLISGKMDLADYIFSILTPSPLLKFGTEEVINRDIRTGKQIRRPGTEGEDFIKHAAATVSPMQYYERLEAGDMTMPKMAQQMMGITTPKNENFTNAEQFAQSINRSKGFGGSMTNEQLDHYHLKQGLADDFDKTGNESNLDKAEDAGKITSAEKQAIIDKKSASALEVMTKHMAYPDVANILEHGNPTPQEKQYLVDIFTDKVNRKIDTLPYESEGQKALENYLKVKLDKFKG